MNGEMKENYPRKEHFDGDELQVDTIIWDFSRKPDTGGANVGETFLAPEGRLVVEWEAKERSCNRCKGPHIATVVYEDINGILAPTGVHAGVRFKKGWLGGPGAFYTGEFAIMTVSRKAWKKVFYELRVNDEW